VTSQIAAAVLVAGGVAVRVLAARGDMWIDEIWSIGMAHESPGVVALLTAMPSDNNHHLNTLFQLLVGPNAPSLVHRSLAIAAGLGTLLLTASSPLAGDRPQRLVALFLMAVSPFAVQYTSEARGYGPALFLALACACLWDAYRRRPRVVTGALFTFSAALGLLSHLTVAFPLAAVAAWALLDLPRRVGWRRAAATLAGLFALPAATLAFLYVFHLRPMVLGGGDGTPFFEALRQAVDAMLGIPRGPLEILSVAALGAGAAELLRMARSDRGRAAFFAIALLAEPAWILVSRPEMVYARYFVVSTPFFLILLAGALRRLGASRPWGRGASAGILAVIAAASTLHLATLLRDGRGHFREVLAWMYDHGRGDVITVGSDHDIPTFTVLRYYARESGRTERVVLLPREQWTSVYPEWIVREGGPEPESFIARNGKRYERVRSFTASPNAGLDWRLYRISDGS